MKVKELIEKLQHSDQDAEVVITSSNFELNGADVSAKYVAEYNEASKQSQNFRDAFDGGSYDTEVWSISGGEEKIVFIG